MSPPLAYFLSWTTKGQWLMGDPRGWVIKGIPGIQEPDEFLCEVAQNTMPNDSVVLSAEQREIVEQTIRKHCEIRGWILHAVNPRTNHVHVIVTANDVSPETAMEQFKAWCSRRLNEDSRERNVEPPRKWWTPHGSTIWINDQIHLHNAINYVLNRQ